MQHHLGIAILLHRRGDQDLAARLGEFHRVVADIGQHLPQPQRVADQRQRHVGRYVEQQLEPFFLGLEADHAE